MKRIALSIAALAAVLLSAPSAKAEEIVVNGSTTVLPIMQKAAETYMEASPKTVIAISGGGSGNGIKALIDGLCTIAMSSRDIKSSEKDAAKTRNVSPERIAIAVDALVPVVHPDNKLTKLTLDDLKAIYEGKMRNWKELGGADAEIVVISRDTASGTFETWDEMVMKKAKVSPRALLQASNGAVVQAVSKNRNAIGYVGIGYLTPELKPLALGNVTANVETALSRTWPLSRELYIFTNGKATGETADFIAFLLDPARGQKSVREAGFVPLAK